jgi:hypothetical protein
LEEYRSEESLKAFLVMVVGNSWTGGGSLDSLSSEAVVAAVAGASARTLLSWISKSFTVLVLSFFASYVATTRKYSFLMVSFGMGYGGAVWSRWLSSLTFSFFSG